MQHPTKKSFREYLNDELNETQAREIANHLDECLECRNAIGEIIGLEFSAGESTMKFGTVETRSGVTTCERMPEFELGQRFLVLGELARGGMGVVYRGFDRELKREVAIKVARGENHASTSARFYREAQISGQLQHPGIIPVYELGRLKDERYFIAMKLVDGPNLLKLIRSDKTNVKKHLEVFGSVCQTMAYAHSENYIHRDLKPENIIVGTFGEVLVMDWGLAKRLRSKSEESEIDHLRAHVDSDEGYDGPDSIQYDPNLNEGTLTGKVFGTPAYMPPEQANGKDTNKRGDVFAIGGILHQILTGNPPFYAATSSMALAKSLESDLKMAHADLDRSGADEGLISLVKNCLAANPDDRPEDAEAVNNQFNAYIASRDHRLESARFEEARSRGQLTAQKKRSRLNVGLAAAIIAAFLITTVSAALYFSEKIARIADQARIEKVRLEQRINSENKILESMANARRFQLLAESETVEENTKYWNSAVNEIEKAEPFADQLTNQKLNTIFKDLEKEIRTAAADSMSIREYLQREAECLKEVEACCIESTNHPRIRSYLDYQVAARLKEAFALIGLRPGDLSYESVSRLDQSKFKFEFLFGLQVWKSELGIAENSSSDPCGEASCTIEWLVDLIDEVDTDPFRGEVRQALADRDGEAVLMLLDSDLALYDLWTIRVCSMAASVVRDKEAVLDYLFCAHQEFPTDFHINWAAANLYNKVENRHSKGSTFSSQHNLICYSLQPNHPSVLLRLGASYRLEKKYDKSIELLEKLAEVVPDCPFVYMNIAKSYFGKGELERANELCNQVLDTMDGDETKALELRARIKLRSGDKEGAFKDLDYAVELAPESRALHSRRVMLYRSEGRLDEAIESMVRLRELRPVGESETGMFRRLLADLHRSLARRCQNEKRFEEAIENMVKAVELEPDSIKLKKQLGEVYVSAQKWELAEKTFRSVLTEDKNDSHSVASIANIMLVLNRPEESEAFIRNAVVGGVNSHEMQFELAKAIVGQEKPNDEQKREATNILERLVKVGSHVEVATSILEEIEKTTLTK